MMFVLPNSTFHQITLSRIAGALLAAASAFAATPALADGRFVASPDGTVIDTQIPDVKWMRCSTGQKCDMDALQRGDGRFVANADGTVTDTELNVTWMRCSAGQTWNGASCDALPERYNFEQAQDVARETDNGPWRLPTLAELQSLVHCSSGARRASMQMDPAFHGVSELPGTCEGDYVYPTIDAVAFPNSGQAGYWSSTKHARMSAVWEVGFGSGGTGMQNLTGSSHVRLVRDN